MFAACLWNASRRGRFEVLELLWAALYGYLLEWLSLKAAGIYHYGHFLIVIDGAPLSIALGWAVIITTTMRFTNQIDLPDAARPILDALLALNIDLALDAVAIRLGLWSWNGVKFDQQWFGVPWLNLWAWFIVVWAFSGFLRTLRPWRYSRSYRWLYPALAVALSLVALMLMVGLYQVTLGTLGSLARPSLILIVGSTVLVISQHPRLPPIARFEPLGLLVPLALHGFALIAGVYAGVFTEQPLLGIVAVAMLIIGLAVHLTPQWVRRSARDNQS